MLAGATTTNEAGEFHFESVPAGSYVLTADVGGFATHKVAVDVRSGRPARFNVVLDILPVAQNVTVTADVGQVQLLTEIAQAVNVISKEKIRERLTTVLAEVVKEEPGLAMQRSSPSLGGVVVRGLTEVTVFVDGVRYTNSAQRSGINTFFNLAESGGLSGVEVLRGSTSAQYGSNSLGGAVHLISRPRLWGWGAAPGLENGRTFSAVRRWHINRRLQTVLSLEACRSSRTTGSASTTFPAASESSQLRRRNSSSPSLSAAAFARPILRRSEASDSSAWVIR